MNPRHRESRPGAPGSTLPGSNRRGPNRRGSKSSRKSSLSKQSAGGGVNSSIAVEVTSSVQTTNTSSSVTHATRSSSTPPATSPATPARPLEATPAHPLESPAATWGTPGWVGGSPGATEAFELDSGGDMRLEGSRSHNPIYSGACPPSQTDESSADPYLELDIENELLEIDSALAWPHQADIRVHGNSGSLHKAQSPHKARTQRAEAPMKAEKPTGESAADKMNDGDDAETLRRKLQKVRCLCS